MGILKRLDETYLVYKQEQSVSCTIKLKDQFICEGGDENIIFTNPFPQAHPVYEIHHGDTIEYVREQSLPLTGVVNFRDLGGYKTLDGYQVKHGHFYRSAPLIKLNDNQKQYLDSLHIHTIYDLRSSVEIKGNEDYIPLETRYIHASGIQELDQTSMKGNFDFSQLMQQADLTTLKKFISRIYKTLPFNNPAYQQMMEDIQKGCTPMLFHCSAGKDRTGFGSALILKTLGVDDQTIFDDYLSSNELRKEVNKKIFAQVGKEQAGMESLMLVYPEYLQQSFDCINETYGDFESYLLKEFGIDDKQREQLKNMYLYK